MTERETRERVEIHYRRPPDDLQIFDQAIVHRGIDHIITFLEAAPLKKAVTVEGEDILQPGAPVVWFTYPGRWYDMGRFHLADGTFTGFYANVLTPVKIEAGRWETTDLFLDVWLSSGGSVSILDEAEFQRAVEEGWIDRATAATAREHAETLALAARQRAWPGTEAREWTLEKVRATLLDD